MYHLERKHKTGSSLSNTVETHRQQGFQGKEEFTETGLARGASGRDCRQPDLRAQAALACGEQVGKMLSRTHVFTDQNLTSSQLWPRGG